MKPKFLLLMLIPLLHGIITTKEIPKNQATNMMYMSIEDIVYNSFSPQEETPGEPIDLGLSVLWASHNMGASYPEGYGDYYAWGELEKKDFYDWSTYKHSDGTRKTCHKLGKVISGTEYDVAHVKWGGKWRMPTQEEIRELCTRCDYVWIKVNGVQGVKFIARNGNTIFFPNSGYRKEKDLYDRGLYGCYWSGTAETRNKAGNAFILALIERYKGWNPKPRPDGCSIRPVMDK